MVRFCIFFCCTYYLITFPVVAKSVYQSKKAFVSEAFSGNPPKPKALWLTKHYAPSVKKILGHNYRKKRIRYWRDENKSAWILEEVGKEKPITLGVIIKQQKIYQLTVLIFREKRGSEVRHRFFTQQFDNAQLTDENQLDRHIDGVSGATLSVRALKKIARLALYLDSKTLD